MQQGIHAYAMQGMTAEQRNAAQVYNLMLQPTAQRCRYGVDHAAMQCVYCNPYALRGAMRQERN